MSFPLTVPSTEVEVVIFEGYRYRRYPNSKNVGHARYFARAGKLLHRAVWEHFNGPIPSGWHVHHIDEDTCNNNVSNLECLPAEEHRAKIHARKQAASKSPRQLEHLARIGELAKSWHKSEEGRAWHSQNAKQVVLRAKLEGKPYFGTHPKQLRQAGPCLWCGEMFVAESKKAKCCNNSHSSRFARYVRTGKGTPPSTLKSSI